MSGLDDFYPDLSTTDTKKKLTVGVNIVNYLKDENNPLDCEDIGGFIDGLVPWMQSSNFKVSFGKMLPASTEEIFRLLCFAGFPEWFGYCGILHRPAGVRVQALPQHHPDQRPGQARGHEAGGQGQGQHRALQADGRHGAASGAV